MTEQTLPAEAEQKPASESGASSPAAGDAGPARSGVDEGGAVVGYNPRPANSAHDKAALARYMEQWRARRQG